MALKQVHIMQHAEKHLQNLVKSRKAENKLGKFKASNRQTIVADAIMQLAKKECKQ